MAILKETLRGAGTTGDQSDATYVQASITAVSAPIVGTLEAETTLAGPFTTGRRLAAIFITFRALIQDALGRSLLHRAYWSDASNTQEQAVALTTSFADYRVGPLVTGPAGAPWSLPSPIVDLGVRCDYNLLNVGESVIIRLAEVAVEYHANDGRVLAVRAGHARRRIIAGHTSRPVRAGSTRKAVTWNPV